MRDDVSRDVAAQVDTFAREEPPVTDFRREPRHAARYAALLGGELCAGPAFTFPETIVAPAGITEIHSLTSLAQHFRGWVANEIAGCWPIMATLEQGHATSVCFSARLSPVAAEAGVETAKEFRGRGLAGTVTAAWALAIRASGRLPIYSTSWQNETSLAVARKLALTLCASDWSLSD